MQPRDIKHEIPIPCIVENKVRTNSHEMMTVAARGGGWRIGDEVACGQNTGWYESKDIFASPFLCVKIQPRNLGIGDERGEMRDGR